MTSEIKIFAETKEQVDSLCEKLNSAINFDEVSNVFDKVEYINDIKLYYNDDLFVGSNHLGQQFVDILREFYPNKIFNNTLDWGCGAGFLGFTVFGHQLTENLVLMDKYRPALSACDKTISEMNTDKISTVNELPNQKFDLVLSNPPWFLINNMISLYNASARKTTDVDGLAHKEFFDSIKNLLADDGIIILVEGGMSSSPLYFKNMIEDNNLKITKVLGIEGYTTYFMIIEAI